jgi:hypothetical protein
MANKFDGDVRPLSNDRRYMGVVFSGTMDEAIAQAKASPEHGLSEQYVPAGISRDRAALLEHLNLLQQPDPNVLDHIFGYKAKLAELEASLDRLALERHIEGRPKVAPGFYTFQYAQMHFPQSFLPAEPVVTTRYEAKTRRWSCP